MDIFICWSGNASELMAAGLRDWIPRVLQSAVPFFSGEDIRSGQRWSEEMSERLSKTNFAILCLNSKNLASTWIHFEAGAVSKNLKSAQITAILLDINPGNVKRPLGQFQHVAASKEGIKKLITDVNTAMGDKLKPELLDDAFDLQWPKFEQIIKVASQAVIEEGKSHPAPTTRTTDDKIDEILSMLRDLQLKQEGPNLTLPVNFLAQPKGSGKTVPLGEVLLKYLGLVPPNQPNSSILEINTDTPVTIKTQGKT